MTTLTIATCWQIIRSDGRVLAFTDHDQYLIIENITYLPFNTHKISAIQGHSDLTSDNFQIISTLTHDEISQEDLLNGLYDEAEVKVFFVDYTDTTKITKLKRGYFGNVALQEGKFYVEVLGMTDCLDVKIATDLYSPSCRAEFCDKYCGLDRVKYDDNATCDKSFLTCCNTYNNALNFRGEPHIPMKITIDRN